MILNALHGDPLSAYGDGRQFRTWLSPGLLPQASGGPGPRSPGDVYTVGGADETENIDVLRRIVELTSADLDLIQQVSEYRPGRYQQYCSRARSCGLRSAGGRGPL